MSEVQLIDQALGPLTIQFGQDNGKYPHGNALLIEGSHKKVMVDPNLGTVARFEQGRAVSGVDLVLHSHAHEDHIAGSHLFADVPWYVHLEDEIGLTGIDGLMQIYGLEEPLYSQVAASFQKDFHCVAGNDVRTFQDGDSFDFGGVQLEVIHTPGHTRGHCCFLISWEGSRDRLVYLGDIELTGFGPYYGDAWSDLASFERSIQRLEQVDAEWWLTFHHKGLIEGRETFLAMLKSFASMIDDRESRLLEYLKSPRTLEDIVEHRFIYRPGTGGQMVDNIERRSMLMHLDRLQQQGMVAQQDRHYLLVS